MPKGKKKAAAKPKAKKPKAKKPKAQGTGKCILIECVKDCPYKGNIKHCAYKHPKDCKWARRG